MDQAIKDAIDEVSRCDDRLGSYSDYEGREDGPTWHFWQRGKADFAAQCERALEDHAAAIKAWRRLRKLNAQRPEQAGSREARMDELGITEQDVYETRPPRQGDER